MVGFSFHELMEGTLLCTGERFDRPFRFELDVRFPDATRVATSAVGLTEGTVRIDGIAKDTRAKGTLELSPFARRRVRYELSFVADDGTPMRFEGEKTIGGRTFTRGWTHLPGEVRTESGKVIGVATLRFSLRDQLAVLLGSVRLARAALVSGAG